MKAPKIIRKYLFGDVIGKGSYARVKVRKNFEKIMPKNMIFEYFVIKIIFTWKQAANVIYMNLNKLLN